jgi:hypothetical protein
MCFIDGGSKTKGDTHKSAKARIRRKQDIRFVGRVHETIRNILQFKGETNQCEAIEKCGKKSLRY